MTLAHIVLLIVVAISFYPLIVMALNSFKTDSEVLRNPAGWPEVWTLASYEAIFQYHGGLWRNFMNSVFVATTSTLIAVWFASMAAFAFAKYQFRGRNLIFALLLAMMMVPFEITCPALHHVRAAWLAEHLSSPDRARSGERLRPVSHAPIHAGHSSAFSRRLASTAPTTGSCTGALWFGVTRRSSARSQSCISWGVWNDYLWPLVVATERSIQPIMVVLPNLRDPHIGFFAGLGDDHGKQRFGDPADRDGVRRLQDKFMSSVVIGAVKE